MADDDKREGAAARSFGAAALDWLHKERDDTDKAIQDLRNTGSAEGLKGTSIAAGILGAQSNRELSAAIITGVEIVDSSVKQLSGEIQTFTTKADEGTARLVWWTKVLAFATAALFIAALVQAWVMWSGASTPQVIIVPRP
jgi:hypothetical protein